MLKRHKIINFNEILGTYEIPFGNYNVFLMQMEITLEMLKFIEF